MTTETRKRRSYTEDFKRDAVALVTEQGYKVTEAARSLGVNANQLQRWKRLFADEAAETQLSEDEREELNRLRKEVRQLRMEKEILKKSQPVLCQGNEVKYGFICDQAGRYPVKRLCEMLKVQRSGFYDWRGQPAKVIAPEELALRRRMKEIFTASRGSLGSRVRFRRRHRDETPRGAQRDPRGRCPLVRRRRRRGQHRASRSEHGSGPARGNAR